MLNQSDISVKEVLQRLKGGEKWGQKVREQITEHMDWEPKAQQPQVEQVWNEQEAKVRA